METRARISLIKNFVNILSKGELVKDENRIMYERNMTIYKSDASAFIFIKDNDKIKNIEDRFFIKDQKTKNIDSIFTDAEIAVIYTLLEEEINRIEIEKQKEEEIRKQSFEEDYNLLLDEIRKSYN